MRPLRRRQPDPRVVYQVASWCLDYPTAQLVERLPLLRRRAGRAAPHPRRLAQLGSLVDHLARTPLDRLQQAYVDVFDLSRKHALYLSYWTDGDTRRRGEVLGRFKAAYRKRLPRRHARRAARLPADGPRVRRLRRPRRRPRAAPGIPTEPRAAADRLAGEAEPYAGALLAVCATLPGRVSGEPGRRAGHGRRRRTTRRVSGSRPVRPAAPPAAAGR